MSLADPTNPDSPRLLLASRSPRRRTLLSEAGFAHDVLPASFEDGPLRPGNVTPAQWVACLAMLKAWAALPKAGEGDVVLGADTACVLGNELIGTPTSADEARTMLDGFAQREHEVVTGVAIIRCGRVPMRTMYFDVARVRMGSLSERDREAYIESGAWRGKAGGYNIRERIDAGWDLRFEGDEGTIVGLPMRSLAHRLERWGVRRGAIARGASC